MPNAVTIPLILDTAAMKAALTETEGSFSDFGQTCGTIVKEVAKTANDIDINIPIKADSEPAKESLKETENLFREYAGKIESIATTIAVTLASAFAIKKGIDFGTEAVKQASAGRDAVAHLDAALKSTGNTTGFTTEQLVDLAKQLEIVTKYEEETTEGALETLAAFDQIQDDQFLHAIKSAQYLATVLKTDLRSAAIVVGKALEDPDEGLQSLKESGVSFTKEVYEQIKALNESGKVLEAQNLILDTLDGKYKDAAKTVEETFGQKVEKVSKRFDSFSKDIGEKLIDGLSELEPAVNVALKLFDKFDKAIEKSIEALSPVAANVNDFLEDLGTSIDDDFAYIEGTFIAFAEEGGRIVNDLFQGMVDDASELKDAHWYVEWFVDASIVSLLLLEDAFDDLTDNLEGVRSAFAKDFTAIGIYFENLGKQAVIARDNLHNFFTFREESPGEWIWNNDKRLDIGTDNKPLYDNDVQKQHDMDMARAAKSLAKRSDKRNKTFIEFKERARNNSEKLRKPKKPKEPKPKRIPRPPHPKKDVDDPTKNADGTRKDGSQSPNGFEDLEALNKRIQAAANASDDPKIKSEQKVVDALNKVADAEAKLIEALQPRKENVRDIENVLQDAIENAIKELVNEGSDAELAAAKQREQDDKQAALEHSLHVPQLYNEKKIQDALSDFEHDSKPIEHTDSNTEEMEKLKKEIETLNKVLDEAELTPGDEGKVAALTRDVNTKVDRFAELSKHRAAGIELTPISEPTIPEDTIEDLKNNLAFFGEDIKQLHEMIDNAEKTDRIADAERFNNKLNEGIDEFNRTLKLLLQKTERSVTAQEKTVDIIPTVGSLKDG